ncbi:hypothetical protein GCK32_003238 [Trichostrongylus colubriformis]|uniref:Uncharacterized protein n=1 Tax=Trichostrongylus colubriformis TaxID=6319 RepID=A0AAN8EV65_TRICO
MANDVARLDLAWSPAAYREVYSGTFTKHFLYQSCGVSLLLNRLRHNCLSFEQYVGSDLRRCGLFHLEQATTV